MSVRWQQLTHTRASQTRRHSRQSPTSSSGKQEDSNLQAAARFEAALGELLADLLWTADAASVSFDAALTFAKAKFESEKKLDGAK